MKRFFTFATMLGLFAWSAIALHAADDAAKSKEDLVIADFEGPNYGGWKVDGKAFGTSPARGTLPGQMNVDGFEGKGLVNSFVGGDDSTGRLSSPAFKIERPWIAFLIGGGHNPGKTCVNLIIDGKTVRSATGPNDKPGGTERLDWQSWDVAELVGKSATLEIVDDQRGGWGHINVDQIIQSERRRGSAPVKREITVSKRYLHLPVKTGVPVRVMRLRDGERIVREFEIELAHDKTDFHAFVDLAAFAGKKLSIETTLPHESQALDAITQDDALPAVDKLYNESARPQFHFTSRRGWLNDPNGLVYLDGEYHLFYQHNPYGWNWGNMHWGHAVSRDLVSWTELPIALYPHKYGDWAFSGSAIVDKKNTSGFKSGDADVLVGAYTSTGRGECIVYSNDRGRTWREYEGNPVVKHNGRDPRLLWHEPTSRWVMAVYDEGQGQAIDFYSSADLKTWKFESKIGGFFECPDIVRLPVDGDAAKSKWILYAADGKYMIGDFDGRRFTRESGKHQLWHGNFYAAQTFTNMPEGRCVQIGWGQNVVFAGMPFNQQMAIACELTLRTTDEGVRLFAEPVKELAALRGAAVAKIAGAELAPGDNPLAGKKVELVDATLTISPRKASRIELSIRGAMASYDVATATLTCQKHAIRVPLADGKLTLRALVDRGSIELFVDGGRVAISAAFRPAEDNRDLSLHADGGTARIESLEVYELRSAWRK